MLVKIGEGKILDIFAAKEGDDKKEEKQDSKSTNKTISEEKPDVDVDADVEDK